MKKIIYINLCLLLASVLIACGSKMTVKQEPGLELLNKEYTYSIIYESNLNKQTVAACRELKKYLGDSLDMNPDSRIKEIGEYEILIGRTEREESIRLTEGLGEHDYLVKIEGKKLIITGGCDGAIINAIKYLIESKIISKEGHVAYTYEANYDGPNNREEYIQKPEGFLCEWAMEFTPSKWMTDYKEKEAAFADSDGRMMSAFHMGDTEYYPANSIEGIISAIHMGADIVEMDLRLTKDGVVVLIHDETLMGSTNWTAKRGRDGLPLSEKVSDWTYEQLCQLRLQHNSQTTSYMIPTFEEALQVCKGRVKVILDKDEAWDWENDVYLLIQKHEAWETCILPRSYSLERQEAIVTRIEADAGRKDVYGFAAMSTSTIEQWKKKAIELKASKVNGVIYWMSMAITEDDVNKVSKDLRKVAGKIRIFGQSHKGGGGIESPKQWAMLHENGINIVLVDDAIFLQQYIAENFKGTKY